MGYHYRNESKEESEKRFHAQVEDLATTMELLLQSMEIWHTQL
jgi:hypothetical protein